MLTPFLVSEGSKTQLLPSSEGVNPNSLFGLPILPQSFCETMQPPLLALLILKCLGVRSEEGTVFELLSVVYSRNHII